MGSRTGRLAALALATAAAATIAAACNDSVGPGACFVANATRYSFYLPGADTLSVFRWPSSYNPVRVYAEPAGELEQNVQAALDLWEDAFRCGELSLSLTADSTRADIVARNPSALPPPAAGTVLLAADSVGACTGVTVIDTAGGRVAGPIHAYVAPRSADTAAVRSCYHFVTAHEIGHALGLGSHSPDTNDLMNALPRRRALSDRDRSTIQLLYHTTPTIGPPPR